LTTARIVCFIISLLQLSIAFWPKKNTPDSRGN
jgi:hypothetical protein